MRSLVRLFVLLAGCYVPLDGGKTDTNPTGPDAGSAGMVSPSCQEATQHSDLAWIQTNVFNTSCVFGGCHKAPANNAGHLVLEAGSSHDALVGKAAETESGWMRVLAGDVTKSYLLPAVGQGSGPTPAGGVMPLASPELCAEKRDAIERWIAGGAQP